jgi:hypothetical protein
LQNTLRICVPPSHAALHSPHALGSVQLYVSHAILSLHVCDTGGFVESQKPSCAHVNAFAVQNTVRVCVPPWQFALHCVHADGVPHANAMHLPPVHSCEARPEQVKPEPDGNGLLHVRVCVQDAEHRPNALQPPLTATSQTGLRTQLVDELPEHCAPPLLGGGLLHWRS